MTAPFHGLNKALLIKGDGVKLVLWSNFADVIEDPIDAYKYIEVGNRTSMRKRSDSYNLGEKFNVRKTR